MDGLEGLRINLLRQKVYERLIDQLRDKFEKSEYADSYSVTYRVTTERIKSDLIEEDEGHYYDSLEAEESIAILRDPNAVNDFYDQDFTEYAPVNDIEKAILDIYYHANFDTDQYAAVIKIIKAELGKLMILPEANNNTFKSEIQNRLEIFEKLNQEGFIRHSFQISEYLEKVKTFDLESNCLNRVSLKDLIILNSKFHDLKSEEFSVRLSCQVSFGNPEVKLLHFSLAILLMLISYDVVFFVDKQGTQRQSDKDTQIMLFARLIHLLVENPVSKLRGKETAKILNNLISSLSGKAMNPFLLERIIKFKEGIVRDDISINKLSNVTNYFRPTDMFGFYGIVSTNNRESIKKKTKFISELLDDNFILDRPYFMNSPLNYLNRYIHRKI